MTSFELSEPDRGAATTGPVTVSRGDGERDRRRDRSSTPRPRRRTGHSGSGSTVSIVACDGEPHAITITPQSDAGPGAPESEEVSSG